MKVKELLESYQTLHMINNKLKYEISKTRISKDNDRLHQLENLQGKVDKLQNQFESQEIELCFEMEHMLDLLLLLRVEFKLLGFKRDKVVKINNPKQYLELNRNRVCNIDYTNDALTKVLNEVKRIKSKFK